MLTYFLKGFLQVIKETIGKFSSTAARDLLIFEAALLDKLFLFVNPFNQSSPGRLVLNLFSITLFLSKIFDH